MRNGHFILRFYQYFTFLYFGHPVVISMVSGHINLVAIDILITKTYFIVNNNPSDGERTYKRLEQFEIMYFFRAYNSLTNALI